MKLQSSEVNLARLARLVDMSKSFCHTKGSESIEWNENHFVRCKSEKEDPVCDFWG